MEDRTAGTIGVIYHPDYLIHTRNYHPESKERLEYILSRIHAEPFKEKITFIEPQKADIKAVRLVHEEGYIESVENACRRGRDNLDPDTYIVPESYGVALLAAGGALRGLDEIMEGRHTRAMALVRPPGHHAEKDRAMGFCLFNNIAVAAKVAGQKYGLERVAIMDWDVHHGNGTQHTFWTDPGVLYISIHQSPHYPGTGQMRETGGGKGEGYTVNIPLPAGCGDAEYMLAFREIVLPVIDEYQPRLLAVSAGQDTFYDDPLAGMEVTIEGYYHMARALAGVADRHCQGKMLICLEGGYHLEGQAEAVASVLNALGGWDPPAGEAPAGQVDESIRRRIAEIKQIQGRYWNLS